MDAIDADFEMQMGGLDVVGVFRGAVAGPSEVADHIPGLYQAGEIAGNAAVIGHTTLGGVSNTNCVVFGQRAGSCAAAYALALGE